MDPFSLGLSAEVIYGIAANIYELNDNLKFNKAQCRFLICRIHSIEVLLKVSMTLQLVEEKRPIFMSALKNLEGTLIDAQKQIKKFTARNTRQRVMRVLFHADYAHDFQVLHDNLSATINDMNLGLNIQHLVEFERAQLNKAEEEQARADDQKEKEQQRTEIMQENQEILKSLQETQEKMPLDSRQRGDIQHQIDALKNDTAIAQNEILEAEFPPLPAPADQSTEKTAALPEPPLSLLFPLSPRSPDIDTEDLHYIEIAWYELELPEAPMIKGSTAVLYKGLYQEENVAIKIVNEHHSPKQRQQILRELKAMTHLTNQRITQIYGACIDEEKIALVMEYMENGSLSETLSNNTLALSVKHQIAVDVLKGLRYLHHRGVTYPKLSGKHILLDANYRAKLTDLWASTAQVNTLQSIVNREELDWMAPEELESLENTSTASDIYRFGLLLWSLFTGKPPFEGLSYGQMMRKIQNAPAEPEDLTALPQALPEGYRELIRSCWNSDPTERPDARALMKQLQALPTELASEEKPLRENHYQNAKDFALLSQHANSTDPKERQQALSDALERYRKAAELGHPKAWRYVGVFYLRGHDSAEKKPKYAKAYEAFLRGAEDNDPNAMRSLAIMLHSGEGAAEGVEKNEQRALFWYQSAGELGLSECAAKAQALSAELEQQNGAQAATLRF